MASLLASQLQQLSRLQQPSLPTTVKKGKASLLFPFQKAADVDLQTIYELASQGFEELVRLEPRFRPYRESLFSRASLDINPEQQTKEFLSKLDESIHAFCCLLSNHFLAPPAFKALEYIVRRYKANERNVDSLMTAALPYHSTNEFVRLVQILALGAPGSLWGWLSKMQTTGASLPRDLLALRCVNDRQLLLFICKAASQLGGSGAGGAAAAAAPRPRNATYLSFYAVLLCEVLALVPSVSEELLAALLPYLLEGLAGGAAQDYRAATLMVVAELCSRATLGRDFVKVMLNTMLKNTEPVPEHIRTVVLVMAHLAVTQTHIRSLSDKTLKYLSSLPNVISELSALAQRGSIRLGPLLLLLVRSLSAALISSSGAADSSTGRRSLKDLLALSHSGVLRGDPALALAKALLDAGGASGTSNALRSSCQQILRVLDQRYPETTDAAVNAYLEPLRAATHAKPAAAAAADGDAAKAAKKQHKGKHHKKADNAEEEDADSDVEMDDAAVQSADTVAAGLSDEDRARFDFVRSTFAAGGYSAPCGGTMMTLAAALAAPQAAVRRMALQQLDADVAAGLAAAAAADVGTAAAAAAEDAPEARSALTAAALERLRDDDLSVVVAALGLACLKTLPPAALLDALTPLAHRLGEFLYGSAKLPQLKAARKAARKVVGLLSAAVAADGASDQLRQSAALQLSAFLLPSARDPRIAVEAARAAGELGLPLFKGLAAAGKELEAHLKAKPAAAEVPPSASKAGKKKDGKDKAQEGVSKKDAQKAAAAGIERTVVSALAKALVADPTTCSADVQGLVAAGASAAALDGAAASASRRSQHLLLLAAHAAAAASKGEGVLLRLVVRVAEMLLPYARFGDSARDWSADFAAQVSAADGLPSPAHLPAMQSEPFATHAVLILGSLQASLARLHEASPSDAADAAAAAASAQRDLGLLAALGCPPEQLRDLPALITTRFVPPAARSSFLSAIYLAASAPPGNGAASAPSSALQSLALHVRAKLASSSPAQPSDGVDKWLVTVLAALSSSDPRVRSAACSCLDQLASLLDSSAAASSRSHTIQTGPHLSNKAALALCKGLAAQRQLLSTDVDGAHVLLQSALQPQAATPASVAAAAAPASETPAAGGKKKTKKKTDADAAAAAATARLELSADDASELGTYLTLSLRDLDASAAGVRTASFVMSCVGPSDGSAVAPAMALVSAGTVYLDRLAARLREDPASASEAEASAMRQLVALFTPASAAAASAAGQADSLGKLAEAAELLPPAAAGLPLAPTAALAAVRLAAVQRITPELFATLHKSDRTARELFAVLLSRQAGDPDEAVRGAARAALEAIPLSSDLVVPLLNPPAAPAAAAAAAELDAAKPSKKKSKKGGDVTTPAPAAAAAAAAAHPPPLDSEALQNAISALELLQWRTGISGPKQLVDAIQSLLHRLLPIVGSIVTTLPSEDAAAGGDDDYADADAAVVSGKSSLAGYACTLGLQALTVLVREDGAGAGAAADPGVLAAFDLGLAVRTAREAPDAAVRNAALGLLAALATKMPEAALSHVLQVLAVINESAALQDDEHSRAVGATALAAVVPAWVAAGQPPAALWEQVATSLPSLPAHRRLDVLLALMRALPQVEEGLSDGVLVLLQHAANPPKPSSAPPATPAQATAATPAKAGKGKKDKGASKDEAVAAATPAAAPDVPVGPPPSEWLPELASQMILQVVLPVRLFCCARVMELALSTSGQQPQTALPRMVVAFVTAQLKLKAAVAAASASYRRPDPDPALEAACRRLMTASLAQMQLLQPDRAASSTAASAPSGKIHRAVLAASRGLYGLFAALQGVMAADTYLQALLTLAEHPADKVKRRAIKLFTDKVRGVRSEIADQIELPQRVRDAKLRQASDAAGRACAMLPPLLRSGGAGADATGGASPLTRQLALIALAAIAAEFGPLQHEALLAGVPAVLQATKDSHASIRASALATVAAFVRALGSRLVPVLPATVAAAVAAADSAWGRLARAGAAGAAAAKDADHDAAMDEADADGDKSQSEDEDDEGESSDEELGVAGGRRRSGAKGKSAASSEQDEAALELSSALACLNALVETLGGFLSPHLPPVLAILLNPRVLACRTAACDKFAASIRARLPTAVPPRLLLPALYERLQPCIDAARDAADAVSAAAPATALLQMVAAAATSLEPKVAVQYHEQMFAFLLRALDVRQRRPAALTAFAAVGGDAVEGGIAGDAAIDAVEAAAVGALVALVMKLSEARFKPLFLRLLEWASTPTVPETGGEPSLLGRMVALFGAVNALTDRLRSVLVPYFRYLLDLCVYHLEGDDLGSAGRARGKKKQKRSAAAAAAAADADASAAAAGASDVQARLAWLLRLRIVRALHRCFLHDSVGFVDPDRFARLQPVLVSQLDAIPPVETVPYLLSTHHADSELSAYISLGPTTRTYTSPAGALSAGPLGAAAVGCLLAMAVAANSDVLWKPLNHATLMLTRSSNPRTRALALEVVAQLVDRLREEYLVLLPEALPFMSELLEDTDAAVAARVREVIAQLEEISGEKLDEYLKV